LQNPNGDQILPGAKDTPQCVAWSPTSHVLASGCWDGNILVYQVSRTGSQPKASWAHGAPVLDVAWNRAGNAAFSAGCDGIINMWDPNTGQKKAIGKHNGPVKSIHYVQTGTMSNMVVSGSWDKTLRFWDIRTPRQVHSVNLPERVYSMDLNDNFLVVATAGVGGNPSGQDAKSRCGKGNVLIFDVTKPQSPFKTENSPLEYQTRVVSCFPDKSGYALGSNEGRVAIQYVVNSKSNFKYKCHRTTKGSTVEVYPINAIAFHRQLGTFATAGSDGAYNFWDKDKRQRLKAFKSCGAPLTCCAFSADGSMFAYGVGYDWHKGASGHNPQAKNAVMVHAVQPKEVTPKGKQTRGY